MRTWVFFLLAALFASAYTDQSFSAVVRVTADGDAHVTEKSVFYLDSEEESKAFNYLLSQGETTLADWQKFSGNVRYHFLGPLNNLNIIAAREYSVGSNAASISIEYDAQQLFLSRQLGVRTTRYELDRSRLDLAAGKPGEFSLGNSMQLEMIMPDDAINVEVNPEPGVVREEYNRLSWSGPITGKWDVSFEREIPLSQEVTEFFSRLYSDLTESYAAWLILLFLALVLFKLAKLRE
jgi:hypothetical protein